MLVRPIAKVQNISFTSYNTYDANVKAAFRTNPELFYDVTKDDFVTGNFFKVFVNKVMDLISGKGLNKKEKAVKQSLLNTAEALNNTQKVGKQLDYNDLFYGISTKY